MNTVQNIAARRFRDLVAVNLSDGEVASEFYLTQEMCFALARVLHVGANDLLDNRQEGKFPTTYLEQHPEGFVLEETHESQQ